MTAVYEMQEKVFQEKNLKAASQIERLFAEFAWKPFWNHK